MSRMNMLKQDLVAASDSIGGGHHTHAARRRTLNRFAAAMYDAGFTHLLRAADIRGRHIRAYVDARAGRVETRTLANELAHVRQAMRARGAHGVADASNLSNRSLGLTPAPRIGTKTAMSDDELARYCARAVELGRPGFAAILRLCRYLGLRLTEALHAQTDTLERWSREIAATGSISVIGGTKGGRERVVRVVDAAAARCAIEYARSVAAAQSGYLVVRRNGNAAGGLKQARSIVHSWMTRESIEPHRARYAFAHAQFAGYLSQGFSEREALILLSHALGHGDGRGRWCRSVYLQGFVKK